LIPDMEKRINELLEAMSLQEKVALLSGKNSWSTMDFKHFGISALTVTDGPHGVRACDPGSGRIIEPATSFPTGVSMAASWNPELIERVGQALAEETKALGCDLLLGPCVNIVRHPLAGRNFESYAEDPYLAGQIGVGFVKGVQSQNVGTSLKHYACNNQEIERMRGSSVVDERTLREIYLAQFETIIKEAKPWTVMCSYNRINGVYASEDRHLLTEILRDEWGYDGVVVSDWGATHTTVESKNAGLDLEMPGPTKYYGHLLESAVQNWQVDNEAVNESVRRMLWLLAKAGKMDGITVTPASPRVNTPEHQRLAMNLAEESIVLLKNDQNLLPLELEKIQSIAVIGPNAAVASIGGGGSSFVDPPYRISPWESLQAKLGAKIKLSYEEGCQNNLEPFITRSNDVTPPEEMGGYGFRGEYFLNTDLSGSAQLVRLDSRIDFWWFTNDVDKDFSSRKFSARWNGKLAVPDSARYIFELTHTGTCVLFVDGKKVLESVRPKNADGFNAVENQVDIELEGGRSYDIWVEYFKPETEASAVLRLRFGYCRNQATSDQRMERALELAKQSDLAIIFAGVPEGKETEGADRRDLELPGRQNELIRKIAEANPRTVVVLYAGSPVAMPWVDEVSTILEAFYPGQEGGHAIVKILTGEINPSGKLPVTFPVRLEDTPAFINYPGAREVFYGEGIFVGYRYYDRKDIQPLFPFGAGLSYTVFEYGPVQFQPRVKAGEDLPVSITIKNTGHRAGKEVVQLYVRDMESSLPRPVKELKGFAKVELEPGETKTVNFMLNPRAFAYYDPYRHQWMAEPGEFEILIGSSSRDVRARGTVSLVEG
jgi:beta-glucosidase